MAFWKKFYKSKYTGAEIDAAIAKADTVPAVTSADAGKALVVDEEGKIVAGEAGGGSDIFVFYVSEDENTGDPVFSKTFNEINAAIADGKIPVGFSDPVASNDITYPEGLNLYGYTLNESIIFQNVSFDFDETFTANKTFFTLSNDNTITVSFVSYSWTATEIE